MDTGTLEQRALLFGLAGLLIGAGFSLFLLPALLTGAHQFSTEYGMTPLQAVAVYLLGGPLGGFVLALLYPIRRWFLGAFSLGVLTTLPVYLGFALLTRRDQPPSVPWILGGILAFLAGGGVATQISSESHDRPVPSPQFVRALWLIVAVCQIIGWYLGLRWPGHTRAAVGLGLVFLPLYVALLATISQQRA
jgi:hypothetical protein